MKEEEKPIVLKRNDSIAFPVMLIPNARTQIAIQDKVEKNLLIKTWGGIGDQICSEPTLRMAVREFTKDGMTVSLASDQPQLFAHLSFNKVFNLKEVTPKWENYLVFDTIVSPDHLLWSFMSHCLTNCVDFPSICAFRMQLQVKDREIFMMPRKPHLNFPEKYILIHPGRHWPSKTFPKDWWDDVIKYLVEEGHTPIIIGADADDNRGTVDIDASNCWDLRNQTTIEETNWICQHATVLLTNDSYPIHAAASRNPNDETSGKTWIGYFATCKHPDYITHWRMNENKILEWNYRERNLGIGGMWNIINNCPNREGEITVDKADDFQVRSWLPYPETVVEWAVRKFYA